MDFDNLEKKKTLKNLNLRNLENILEKHEISNNFNMFSCNNSIRHKKFSLKLTIFCHHLKFILVRNILKVTLQYLFYFFIQFNTVSYTIINYKLKIDPKMCTFKNLKEIWKTFTKFLKRVATL